MEEVRKIKSDLDIQIIGSDISLNAIETAQKNMDHAQISSFADSGIITPRIRKTISNPLVYSEHWPKKQADSQQAEEAALARNEVLNFGKRDKSTFMSLY